MGAVRAVNLRSAAPASCTQANTPFRSVDEPVTLDGLVDVVALGAAGSSRCVVEASGAVRCWGSDLARHPFQSAAPVLVDVAGPAVDVAVRVHACVVRRDGAVLCWGRNWCGEADPMASELTVSREASQSERRLQSAEPVGRASHARSSPSRRTSERRRAGVALQLCPHRIGAGLLLGEGRRRTSFPPTRRPGAAKRSLPAWRSARWLAPVMRQTERQAKTTKTTTSSSVRTRSQATVTRSRTRQPPNPRRPVRAPPGRWR